MYKKYAMHILFYNENTKLEILGNLYRYILIVLPQIITSNRFINNTRTKIGFCLILIHSNFLPNL